LRGADTSTIAKVAINGHGEKRFIKKKKKNLKRGGKKDFDSIEENGIV